MNEPPNHPVGAADTAAAQPVSGINVFWIIFLLGITSAWHPLGSSIGFPHNTRRYIRIFPLTALFDTVLLYAELVSCMRDTKRSLRVSARSVSTRRLHAGIPSAEGIMDDDEGSTRRWLKAMIAFIGLDVRVRFLGNALVVFAYTKMFGYGGTPVSLAIATLQFASWLGNEVFLLLTYGFSWTRASRELAAAVDGDELTPTRTHLPASPGLISMANRLLLAGQVIAFVAFGLWSVASATHHTPTPAPLPGAAFSFWDTIGGILDVGIRKLLAPLFWYWDSVVFTLVRLMGTAWSFSPFVALILSPIFILVFLVALVPALPLLLFATAGVSFLICSPLLVLMLGVVLLLLICNRCIVVYKRLAPMGLSSVVWARGGSFLVLAGLLVYYLHYWDSDGTSKAPWTENLG